MLCWSHIPHCWNSLAQAQKTICMLGNFLDFLSCAEFFQKTFQQNILSEMSSECHVAWIQIRPDFFVGLDLGSNCLQGLFAEDTNK